MKKILVMITLSLFVVGCGLQNVSKEEQIPVIGKIIVDATEYEMRVGNYKWKGEKMSIEQVGSTDTPMEIAKGFNDLVIEKNSKIEILIEDDPNLTVYQYSEDGKSKEITLTEKQITVPSNSGHYIYEVVGKWSDGEASFIFDVEIK
ncbi:hypothetical protein [Mesobacillus jeotgali]|uniref:hypothetical protein n=1 Tax=Mesobacillus jeotgali TaxID=129985 RepID=UPI00177D4B95|nr:hypothetical protein [Mesobacillus jeotgali]UYZ20224.1 hypothetical protein FOF60_14150 [Mesobacillus jeotgali]